FPVTRRVPAVAAPAAGKLVVHRCRRVPDRRARFGTIRTDSGGSGTVPASDQRWTYRMRLRTLMSSVALAALVATGSVVAPAAAGGASAADPATPSSVTITVRDVKNKAGTYTLKRWATVDVK